MSRWNDRVRKALADDRVRAGIGLIAANWMVEHIERNEGRGKGGGAIAHKPLKPVYGERWVSSKPRGGGVIRTRTVETIVNGRVRRRTEYLVRTEGFRTSTGGKPLQDTGNLIGSVGATARSVNRNRLSIVLSGPRYGLYQDRGFKTKGPNYIPLTMKGRRGHATGANPNAEGLERGKDFRMAWKGVTVPSRPFLLPTRADLRTLGKSIFMGLKAVLKGR